MADDAAFEPIPQLDGQTSIHDFLPPTPATTPVEIREPTDRELAAFFEAQSQKVILGSGPAARQRLWGECTRLAKIL